MLEVLSMQIYFLSISILIELLGIDLRHLSDEVLENISLFLLLRLTVVLFYIFFKAVISLAFEGVLL